MRFLGYNLMRHHGWADRLVKERNAMGLTLKQAAARIGVDSCTSARWEHDREPKCVRVAGAAFPQYCSGRMVAARTAWSL